MKALVIVVLAAALAGCCLVRVPVACCGLAVAWWEYEPAEAARAERYALQLSDAVDAYARSARDLEPQVRAERERREQYCREHADDPVGTLGETRRTKGWCP